MPGTQLLQISWYATVRILLVGKEKEYVYFAVKIYIRGEIYSFIITAA